jgi:hypothetical protein
MIELITTAVIIASSGLLFVYWFRYSCLLMLHTRTARDYSTEIAMANQLSFANVQAQLSQAAADLGGLRASLDQDYAVVMRLMEQASAGQAGIEQKMLAIHYRLMGAWYSVGTHFSPTAARQALEEMSLVVAHFANSIGEAAASPSAA